MAHAGHSEAAHHAHHILPKRLLIKVFIALVALTIFTVLTAQLDLGLLNVPLALAIAGSKSALVVMFFMALKYDNRVNTLVFVVGTIFVAVFLIFTLFDTLFRGDLTNVEASTISDMERMEEQLRLREPGAAVGAPVGADTLAGPGGEVAPADTLSDPAEEAAPADTLSEPVDAAPSDAPVAVPPGGSE
jgi:cytochrome c oxidase subunit IV